MSQLPGIIPTEQDEMLFEKIIELDQSKFQQAQGKLSVDPLRGSIIQWANDIQQRNENFFRTESPGLTDEKAAEDLIGRLLHLYENLNEESHKSANSSLKSVDRVSF